MIASLEGIIAEASPTNIVLEVGGVGYEVHVPVTTAERLPGLNQKTKLHIRAIYREDTQALYGFATREDKDLFNVIIDKVSGVGPKIALGILSQHNADTLKAAIATEDVKLLSKCPGIGKKSAERIIVELKDFMGASLLTPSRSKNCWRHCACKSWHEGPEFAGCSCCTHSSWLQVCRSRKSST